MYIIVYLLFSKVKRMQTHKKKSLHWTLRATDRLRFIFQCTCTAPSQSIFLHLVFQDQAIPGRSDCTDSNVEVPSGRSAAHIPESQVEIISKLCEDSCRVVTLSSQCLFLPGLHLHSPPDVFEWRWHIPAYFQNISIFSKHFEC